MTQIEKFIDASPDAAAALLTAVDRIVDTKFAQTGLTPEDFAFAVYTRATEVVSRQTIDSSEFDMGGGQNAGPPPSPQSGAKKFSPGSSTGGWCPVRKWVCRFSMYTQIWTGR